MHRQSLRWDVSTRSRRQSRVRRAEIVALLALANFGAACASGSGSVRDDAPAPRAAPPPPDFAKLDAEIDAILFGDWPNGDPSAYAYVPTGKRDPFRPPPDVVQPKGEDDHVLSPLSRCPSAQLAGVHVDELRLEGIVRTSRGSEAHATIAAPDGRGLIIAVGDELGDECASVAAILDDTVVLTVPQRTQRGQESQRRHVLHLRHATDDETPID